MAFATDTYVIKGMRQDDSELLFNGNKEGLSYAYENFNMRFSADTASTLLVATQEKGNKQYTDIRLDSAFFLDSTPSDWASFESLPMKTIGCCTVDKYLVLFGKCTSNRETAYTNDDSKTLAFAEGNDIIIRFERDGDTLWGWLLYNGDGLNFDIEHPLETLGNVETEIVKKVYFVDGVNITRSVNVVNPDAGSLSNINLSYSLKYPTAFNVEKDYTAQGHYPMGKVRFFFTYYNDLYSETNIVDWSPFFDCNYTNQGGAPDSTYTTPFTFKMHIEGTDSQFKFVRVYMQHFTSDDPNVYKMKYIERRRTDIMDVTLNFDGTDMIETTETYLDKQSISYTMIPATMAEKNNRMFYGDIKRGLPSLQDINLEGAASVTFVLKTIGDGESLEDRGVLYRYESDKTSFKGSNFDYMGFRKDNWYRFGIIAQYKTGEWSEVLHICDKRCDKTSATKVEYREFKDYVTVAAHGGGETVVEVTRKVPVKSVYKIPYARLTITDTAMFKQQMDKLKALGFMRIKPVCVVPPPGYRDVITQGISCSTLYVGNERNNIHNNGLFAMPSWFFRPVPLYPQGIIRTNNVVKADYPYTIRKVSDLVMDANCKIGGKYILNPTYDDDRYIHYNPVFREWRHGFSLPPKDRINAELQSSDMSLHDRFYMLDENTESPLLDAGSKDLFSFIYNRNESECWLKKLTQQTINFEGDSWIEDLVDKYDVLPYHSLYAGGFNNAVFVDESILTLNSPEIDYDYSRQVAPFFKDNDIEVVGYAQVTGSAMDCDIPDKRYEADKTMNENIDSDIDNVVTGKCLFGLRNGDTLDADTKKYIDSLASSIAKSQPFTPLSGPWWLDTMLVNSFRKYRNSYDTGFSTAIGMLFAPIQTLLSSAAPSELDENLFGSSDSFDVQFNTDTNVKVNLADNALYNVHDTDDGRTLDVTKRCDWYVRGIEWHGNKPIYHWTTSFYGETNKFNNKDNERNKVVNYGNSPYPHTTIKKGGKLCVFNEFPLFEEHKIKLLTDNSNAYIVEGRLAKWGTIPMTWNTISSKSNSGGDDLPWTDFFKNREISEDYDPEYSENGTITLEQSINVFGDFPSNILYDDLRGLFGYYFFPYYLASKPESFYRDNANVYVEEDVQGYWRKVSHPWLLPFDRTHNWATDSQTVLGSIDYIGLCDTDESLGIPYMTQGSEFGCHYYAPFSTNFTGGYFEPYYAHVVYPFMTTSPDTPFCGSHNAYRQGYSAEGNARPAYNSTHSMLYSNCTNYVDSEGYTPKGGTYSDFHCAPDLAQLNLHEPELGAPMFKNSQTANSYFYSYGYSQGANPVRPIVAHRTYTLTAAMKWYRGFKSLYSKETLDPSGNELISMGCYLDKSALAGNLMFSGWLPQFFTKNGLLTGNMGIRRQNYQIVAKGIYNTHKSNNRLDISQYVNDFLANDVQLLEIAYHPMPHIVYCHQRKDNTLDLLDKFYVEGYSHESIIGSGNVFQPQFYYKEFVNENLPPIGNFEDFDNLPLTVKDAFGPYWAIYPHTGCFQQYHFDKLIESDQPWWNRELQLSAYPPYISEEQIQIEADDEKLVRYDSEGKSRSLEDYWLLPISNVYDSSLIQRYTEQNANPYTYENISIEHWDWKMCGETMDIDTFFTSQQKVELKFLEGDTYFQRYNCLKTVSGDAMAQYLSDDSDVETLVGNDVTESASVMLESYVNIDGLYWEHRALKDNATSPMLHPFYNHSQQINTVYGIQNGLCDVFKQIDYYYYDATLDHYPTQIMWSAQKQDGEDIDSYGIVPANNRMLVSGEMGGITKLLSFNDNVFCLQEHGLSVLNYNAQVIAPTSTESTLSVYLSDSTRLQDVTYLSRNTGTLNRRSVAVNHGGFYWVDETLRQICGYRGAEGGIVNVTSRYGFDGWAKYSIAMYNPFIAHSDLATGDLYWSDGRQCIGFNEGLDGFTSFYGYNAASYKARWQDTAFSILDEENTTLWQDDADYSHTLYGEDVDAYVQLMVNPIGQYDKVFNFIEYNAEAYMPGSETIIEHFNPWTNIYVENMYQYGEDQLDIRQNTKERFRLWRTSLPRQMKFNEDGTMTRTINRIRGPWCKIMLMHKATEGHSPSGHYNEYRDKLYYINVNYTIPEQPQKTNMRR